MLKNKLINLSKKIIKKIRIWFINLIFSMVFTTVYLAIYLPLYFFFIVFYTFSILFNNYFKFYKIYFYINYFESNIFISEFLNVFLVVPNNHALSDIFKIFEKHKLKINSSTLNFYKQTTTENTIKIIILFFKNTKLQIIKMLEIIDKPDELLTFNEKFYEFFKNLIFIIDLKNNIKITIYTELNFSSYKKKNFFVDFSIIKQNISTREIIQHNCQVFLFLITRIPVIGVFSRVSPEIVYYFIYFYISKKNINIFQKNYIKITSPQRLIFFDKYKKIFSENNFYFDENIVTNYINNKNINIESNNFFSITKTIFFDFIEYSWILEKDAYLVVYEIYNLLLCSFYQRQFYVITLESIIYTEISLELIKHIQICKKKKITIMFKTPKYITEQIITIEKSKIHYIFYCDNTFKTNKLMNYELTRLNLINFYNCVYEPHKYLNNKK